MESQTKRRLGAVGIGIAIACVAGVAFAAFLSSGAGSASGSSTVAVASTITPNTPAGNLYPGAVTTATVTVNNQNSYPVQVTSISSGSSLITNANCPAGSVTTDASTNPAGTIAPGGTATYTLTARMIANPDNTCQNQTFTIPLTASLASAAS